MQFPKLFDIMSPVRRGGQRWKSIPVTVFHLRNLSKILDRTPNAAARRLKHHNVGKEEHVLKKRFPALILSLTLLFCVTAYAAEPCFVVHLPEKPVEAGEDFTVTVDLTGNPGILNIQFTLSFDRERMECTDMKIGELLAAQAMASAVNPDAKSGAKLASVATDIIEGDGQVAVYHFRAKEKLSDFHFSLEKIDLGNQSRENIDVIVTGGGGTDTASGKPDTDTASGKSGTDTASRDDDKPDTDATSTKPDTDTTSTKPDTDAASGKSETSAAVSGGDAQPLFTDIAGTWAESYIREAAEQNLFQGYPDGTFRPDNHLTRAQFMMVLWNLAGRPAVPDETPFKDMGGQIQNFRHAVAWAYAKGYVNGTSPDTFSPGEPLTRQAAVKILFAYNGSKRGTEVMITSVYDDIFSDSGRISAWAKDAMYWAVYQKIISGTSSSTLEPGGTVTRAQLAAMMVRYAERFPR